MKKKLSLVTMVRIGAALVLAGFILGITHLPLPSPSSLTPCASGSIAIGGSTALLPLVSNVTEAYHETCSQATLSLNQNVTSSKAALSTLEIGTLQVGNSDLLSSNLSLVDHPLAAVIYVLIVNANVSQVSNLTLPQIQKIYQGSFTNWRQVGGKPMPIFVVNRTSTSGTRATFEQYLLAGQTALFPANQINRYAEEDTSELVAQKVASTPGAIGYVDLRDALVTANLKIVTLDGIQATAENVKRDVYPFWTIEHIYTQRNPSDLTNAFLQYMSSESVKALMSTLGYVPLDKMPSAILNQHPSPRVSENL